MRTISLIIIITIFNLKLNAQTKLTTFFESSGFLETPTYEATVDFAKKLDQASPFVSFQTFGKSSRNVDLPLLIADKDGFSDFASVKKSGRAVLLIQACIHSGEPDGKDAGFMLLRDIIEKPDMKKLLDNVTIIFVPILNVDGHNRFSPYNRINQNGPKEMGWRTTALNLNLNRDFMKADAPETRAWLKLFDTWKPDFFSSNVDENNNYIWFCSPYKWRQAIPPSEVSL